MPNSARVTDIWVGICCCHPPAPCIGMSGVIITGDNSILTNNLPTARITDVVIGACGHAGVIVSSASTVTSSNLGKARMGDSVAGCTIGTIVTSSPDVSVIDSGG